MKKLIIVLSILFIGFTNICYSQSGWFWQNPLPQGNNLYSVHYINSNLIYAIGDAGTFMKSTNGGINWIITYSIAGIYIDLSLPLNTSCFLNSTTGFVGAGWSDAVSDSNKILRTSNGGISWDCVTTSNFPTFRSIFFVNDNTGWSCCNNMGTTVNTILKTTNCGLNWLIQNSSLQPIISIYFINSNTGWITGYYATMSGNAYYIYKTTNGGDSYISQLYVSNQSSYIKSIFFTDANSGWACGSKIWKTTDSGLSWNSQNISGNSISFANSQTGFCIQDTGILKSTNSGINWIPQNSIGGNDISILDPNNSIVVGNFGTIIRTSNGGASWILLSQSITNNTMYGLFFINENTGFAIHHYWSYPPYTAGLLKTTDKGLHWNLNFQNNSHDLNDVFFTDDLTGWICGVLGLVYKTSNSGSSWTLQNIDSNIVSNKIYFINQNTGWILGYVSGQNSSCILITNNGGSNWNRINITEPYLNNMTSSLLFVNNNTGIIAGAGIGRTTNGGYNWQLIQYQNSIEDIAKDNLGNIFAIGWHKFYKSTDSGLNWQIISSPNNAGVALKMLNSTTGYMSCLDGILLKTTDSGVNWDIRKLCTNSQLRSFFVIDTNKIWVIGDGGLILSTVCAGAIGIKNESNTIAKSFFLSQNYPNPFNPVTRIKFDLPKSSNVKLVIYDILGREIVTLLDENKKPGTYEVDWDGSNYASGVYFYKLITDEFVETKKMVLLK